MKIENFKEEKKGDRARIAATVTWENSDRGSREIYFETDKEFADDLTCNPHAFLVACIMPALRHGEERIFIDAEICPELRVGLMTAMGWIRQWYEVKNKPVRIEAKTMSHPPNPHKPPRAASLLSGGIDSLATLRANRLNFPLEHPESIKDCLFVHGFDIGVGMETSGAGASDHQLETFDRALSALSHVAQDANVRVIPVYTNIRRMDTNGNFWMREFHGAAIAAVAHAFSKRLTTVSLASTFDIPNYVMPWGSHPLLDPNYSSSDLRIRHDGVAFSRFAKTQLISDWDAALQNLRVCTQNPVGQMNCANCEKCVRTMTALLATGVLHKTSAFPVRDVSAKVLLAKGRIRDPYGEGCYMDLSEPLAKQGRRDLVVALQRLQARYHQRGWLSKVKKFDEKHLNSALLKFKRGFPRSKLGQLILSHAH